MAVSPLPEPGVTPGGLANLWRWAKMLNAAIEARYTSALNAVSGEASARQTGLNTKADAPTLTGKTLSVYGDSWVDEAVMVPGQVPTAAGMYYRLVAAALAGNSPVTYGRGGMRIDFGVGSLLAAGAWPGHLAPPAGSVWPGVSNRPGPVIADYLINDIAHTNGISDSPVAISGAGGTRYTNGIRELFKAFCAIASSETRREISSGVSGVTFNGAGWATFGGTTYLSNSDFSWTDGSGNYVELTNVIPPQSGPFAGKVFVSVVSFDPGVLPNASATISVDGGAAWTWTKTEWEAYGAGNASNQAYAVIPIELPADTAGHTIRVTRSGSAGQYLTLDALFIPSTTPPDIYVMDVPDVIVGSAWDASEIAIWVANRAIIEPVVRAAVAEFPNAVWVPTTMTPGVLWVDGIHPQAEGMIQRASDLLSAIKTRTLLAFPAAKILLGS